MGRLFIVFMIVLLPLRAWAGDLMGVQMAASGLTAQAASGMPSGCPMHAQAGATDVESKASPAQSGGGSCTSCDLCIPMAEPADTSLVTASFAAHAKPLLHSVDFISVPLAPTLKPPIS